VRAELAPVPNHSSHVVRYQLSQTDINLIAIEYRHRHKSNAKRAVKQFLESVLRFGMREDCKDVIQKITSPAGREKQRCAQAKRHVTQYQLV
jgi:hypothetical protein